MARKYKIKRKKASFLTRLLPDAMQAFLARRILDFTGLGFMAAGAFLLVSFFSYDQADPSWNSAGGVVGGTEISNWMGRSGANLSDLFLQTLGAASFLAAGAFCIWGFRIFRRLGLSVFVLRFIALGVALLTGAVAFARVPSLGWLAQPYAGGSGGQLMLQSSADLAHFLHLPMPHIAVAILAGLVTLFAFSMAVGIGWAHWRWGLAWAWAIVTWAALSIVDMVAGFTDWVRHYGDESFENKRPKRKKLVPEISKPKLEQRSEPVLLEQSEEVLEEENQPGSEIKVFAPQVSQPKTAMTQTRFQLFDGGEWELPSLDLLQEVPENHDDDVPDEKALRMNAELLQNVLSDFNIQGEIVSIHPGPVVTLYELEPAPGTKSSRVIGLADDIARSMSAVSVRAAVVPGRNVIGIEIPNQNRQTVYLRELLATRDYDKTKTHLPLVLGKDIGGKPIIADLARMPHLLIAGTTGSGKSVAVNTMVLSLLYRLPPEKCRFIMIDPKMLELSVYDDIPHLLSPVVTEPGKAVVALKWVVQEMEERYRAMSKLGVRNIDGYNTRLAEARKKGETLMRKVQTGFDPESGKPVYEDQPIDLTDLPYIVVIVDEFADLMLVAGKDVENAIQRLAQMARAAGIHLIMATQRPSVDVITGVIKANFPTRISFAVTSKIDSRTILGDGGAEQLLGMGDMLYMAAGGRITRVHGPFASDEDVENVVTTLKSQAEPSYLEDITEGGSGFEASEVMDAMFGGAEGNDNGVDELYDQAVALVAREQKASTSFIQRYLQIGYNRAARIIEEMERQGVVGPANKVGKRDILISDHSGAA